MKQLPELKLADGKQEIFDIVTDRISRQAGNGNTLSILEAGCGRHWPFDLQDVSFTLTGIDMDKEALNARMHQKKDIDNAIHGDLRSVQLNDREFDVIYSAYVLEHIRGSKEVLDRFIGWLKPGGILVLRFPNRDSVYGFVTRVTPQWFHVFYKKYVRGHANAGKPGHGPYPTYHDEIISRKSFHKYVKDNGLQVVEEYGYGSLPGFLRLFTLCLAVLSFGRLQANHINLLYVLRKKSD